MAKVLIYYIGKVRESYVEEGIAEFTTRLRSYLPVEISGLKDDQQLVKACSKEPQLLCLDPAGRLVTSETFCTLLFEGLEKGGARMAFAIGGAEGLPIALRERPLLSLSSLTFTHQLARLILVEQIYRACEIRKGTPYHK